MMFQKQRCTCADESDICKKLTHKFVELSLLHTLGKRARLLLRRAPAIGDPCSGSKLCLRAYFSLKVPKPPALPFAPSSAACQSLRTGFPKCLRKDLSRFLSLSECIYVYSFCKGLLSDAFCISCVFEHSKTSVKSELLSAAGSSGSSDDVSKAVLHLRG